MVDLMVNGHGGVVPVIMNVGGEAKGDHAFFTWERRQCWRKDGCQGLFVLECPIITMDHITLKTKKKFPVGHQFVTIRPCVRVRTGHQHHEPDLSK